MAATAVSDDAATAATGDVCSYSWLLASGGWLLPACWPFQLLLPAEACASACPCRRAARRGGVVGQDQGRCQASQGRQPARQAAAVSQR
jgi:hypothetical protein